MWRIRYLQDDEKGGISEYWLGDIFIDEVLHEIIKAVTKKDICLEDIVIQDLESPQYEIVEGMSEEEIDNCEEMYDVEGFYHLITHRDFFIEDREILLPQVRDILNNELGLNLA